MGKKSHTKNKYSHVLGSCLHFSDTRKLRVSSKADSFFRLIAHERDLGKPSTATSQNSNQIERLSDAELARKLWTSVIPSFKH